MRGAGGRRAAPPHAALGGRGGREGLSSLWEECRFRASRDGGWSAVSETPEAPGPGVGCKQAWTGQVSPGA